MFQKKTIATSAAAILFVFASGCMLRKERIRNPMQEASFAAIESGGSTISDVGAVLGAPNQIVWSNGITTYLNADQDIGVNNTFTTGSEDLWVRAYIYRYTVQKTSGFTLIVFSMISYDTKYDEAVVFFDKSGTVTHVTYSNNSGKVTYNPFK